MQLAAAASSSRHRARSANVYLIALLAILVVTVANFLLLSQMRYVALSKREAHDEDDGAAQSGGRVHAHGHTYSSAMPPGHHENRKAIIVYLDSEQDQQIEEFSWLYKSWLLWDLDREFDMLVYHKEAEPAEARLDAFGLAHPHLLFRSLAPLADDPIWENYPYVHSFRMFNAPEEREWLVSRYDYLLRTDCDVFLTRHIAGYEPSRTIVGIGDVIPHKEPHKTEVLKKLAAVQKQLDLHENEHMHIGASIFSKTGKVMAVTWQQYRITKHLLENEWKESPGEWPGWYKGVVSMYAMHLVINDFFTSQHLLIGLLDEKCWKTTALSKHVLHIHAWHTDQAFSKFAWFDGKYSKLEVNGIPTNAADYCLWVASNTLEEMKAVVAAQAPRTA